MKDPIIGDKVPGPSYIQRTTATSYLKVRVRLSARRFQHAAGTGATAEHACCLGLSTLRATS